MKKLLSIAVLTMGFVSFGFAENTVVMPYTGIINYDKNSKKDIGNFYGLYLKKFNSFSNNYVEMNFENDKIKYKEAKSDYIQNSISFIYNVFTINQKYKTKIGINYLNINDQNNINKNNYVYIWGNELYSNKGILGFDVYYSKLDNSVDHSLQISPYINIYSGKLGFLGTLYTKLQYNYIKLKNKNSIDNKKNYNNLDITLTSYNPNGFTTSFRASIGKSSYKVDKGGFVLYNTGNIINHSYQISENITFGAKKDKFIKFEVTKTNIKDYDQNNKLNSNLKDYTYSIMIGFVF